MCGICALLYRRSDQSADHVQSMAEEFFPCVKHRGPEHSSEQIVHGEELSAFMGFQRLAIIDPSPQSNCVLRDQGTYLICNGEIYNYQYLIDKYQLPVKTGSDCEVILQLYLKFPTSRDWLQELDGVFAFVLFDSIRDAVFAARDRIGVRPMFMGSLIEDNFPTELSFASELKAIPHFNGKQFPPGHFYFTIDSFKFGEFARFWKPPRPNRVSYDDGLEIIRSLLKSAVQKRLRADRPVGFLVSGGLDSSLVAAIANAQLPYQITTFSIGLPGSPDLLAARQVAQHLHSDHHEVHITVEDIIAAVPKVIEHLETYDITTIRASIPMYLISKYIKENTDIRVVFSGEGADELFGGYLYFNGAPDYASFQAESERLIQKLHMYDVLRGDRTTAAWGLEIRVPFLDADLLDFVLGLDPRHKMPHYHERLEKAILRDAFNYSLLPQNILYRRKVAFSDGVGSGSVGILKEHAESLGLNVKVNGGVQPQTPEAHWYCHEFNKLYGRYTKAYPQEYWMPRWYDGVTDPSATVLCIPGVTDCSDT